MKILLSAFACAPNTGSEGGVGWRWALELAREHEVVVLTDVTRREAIEAYLGEQPLSQLRFVFFRPAFLRSMPLNSRTAQILYTLWQFALLPFARRLHRAEQFDLAMHLTYGVHRHPSFLGWLGIPFVMGPVGGGEDAPLRLKRSIRGREKLKELARSAINVLSLFDPFLWLAYAKAALILVKTDETRRALPWPFRRRAVVHAEIGVDVVEGAVAATRQPAEPLRVLFAGRLLGWKGAHLVIRAMAAVWQKGLACELTIVGRGPFEAELRRLAAALGVEARIRWVSFIPQNELFQLYAQMHCLLFPSLHDSSGNVVLEAQSRGVPVICLDLGGPPTLVKAGDTALVVSTAGRSEEDVVAGLAAAVETLFADEARRRLMAAAAISHVASEMSWSGQVCGVMCQIDPLIRNRQETGRR